MRYEERQQLREAPLQRRLSRDWLDKLWRTRIFRERCVLVPSQTGAIEGTLCQTRLSRSLRELSSFLHAQIYSGTSSIPLLVEEVTEVATLPHPGSLDEKVRSHTSKHPVPSTSSNETREKPIDRAIAGIAHEMSLCLVPAPLHSSPLRRPFDSSMTSTDRRALIDLYAATGGRNWVHRTNWNSSNLSEWYGVHVIDGRVVELHLGDNNLRGENVTLTALATCFERRKSRQTKWKE